jgi:tetratricopeptide (TPR) repeat protein
VLALLVRLAHLAALAGDPCYLLPVLDERTYHKLAVALAHGQGFGEGFFYQPFFYPFFLAIVYSLAGVSFLAARMMGAIVGTVTCVLVVSVGSRAFGRRVGELAGAIAACYGPLVFADAQMLAESWAACWATLLLWLLVEPPARSGSTSACLILGAAFATALQIRPTFLPFVAAAAYWAVTRARLAPGARRTPMWLALSAGAALIMLPVALLGHRVTGSWQVLPSSGGINLYIGNSTEHTDLAAIRPGYAWELLVAEPYNKGAENLVEANSYFTRLAVRESFERPYESFLRGLGKCLQVVSSRELPRNDSIESFRTFSPVLALLTWRVGAFGFPAGVLFPLAAIGLVARWHTAPVPLRLLVLVFPLSMVVVFASARYRVPMLPALCVLAAAGASWLVWAVRTRRRRELALALAGTVLTVACGSLPGRFPQERGRYDAELRFQWAAAELDEGCPDRALGFVHEGLTLEPASSDGLCMEASVLEQLGRLPEAETALLRATTIAPNNFLAWDRLGEVYALTTRTTSAASAWERALAINPADHPARLRLAKLAIRAGDYSTARHRLEQGIRDHPTVPTFLAELAWVLSTAERPADRDGTRALELANQARRRAADSAAEPLLARAAALAELGRYQEAVADAEGACSRAVAARNHELADWTQTCIQELRAHHPLRGHHEL